MEFKPESRIIWEEHDDKRCLYLNFQDCSDEQRIQISKIATNLMENEPLNSVSLIIDLNNTIVSVESMRTVKAEWNRVRPNIKKSALLGVNGFKSVLLKVWWSITGYHSRPFKSKDEAIKYLFKPAK